MPGIVSPGFFGRKREGGQALPPGQYLVRDFPVLSAGPTPRVTPDTWEFRIVAETGEQRTWDWAAFRALPGSRCDRRPPLRDEMVKARYRMARGFGRRLA